MKTSLILKWIFGSESFENVISGEEKIKNITARLDKMSSNGYLRLFEIDVNILKGLLSDSSWILFEDFKTKRQLDAWKCPQCASFFIVSSLKWKCERCLFWYLEKCTKARKIMQKEEPESDVSLCNSCFFAL